MNLSILDIERGAKEINGVFDEKLEKLNGCVSKLEEDEKIQLYIFLQNEIDKTESNKKERINEYIENVREKCNHSLYICVTNGDEETYNYKCICLSCGHSEYFKQYELDKLYNEHKVIAKSISDTNGNHHYSSQTDIVTARNFYKETYKHLKELNRKLSNNEFEETIELAASEMTFNYFVHPEKKFKKVIKKTLN